MKFISVVSMTLLLTLISGCQTDNLLGLDDSAITVLAINKNVDETNRSLTKVMQASGYKIDKTDASALEFRRGIKGVLDVLSTSERLQQDDVVNCLLTDQEGGTLISCRTYLESVNRKGHERRTEKTQAIGYRVKLEKELGAINGS
jgi:hypothetical protein